MLLKDMLKGKSHAAYVEYGYGQVEPNHLSAQRNGQIYAQLPADPAIDQLEQGQFVKYDYRNGLVNFTGAGEWMLVFNEIKLYRDNQYDCEFAMLKDNYVARIYSPVDGLQVGPQNWTHRSRTFNGVADSPLVDKENGKPIEPAIEKVTAGPDMYELHYEEDPFHFESSVDPALMPAGATMVPRVFKTMVGDIFTTNTINERELTLGDILVVGEKGILCKTSAEKSDSFAGSGDMQWQVVKVYNLPDYQKAVKIMRIK